MQGDIMKKVMLSSVLFMFGIFYSLQATFHGIIQFPEQVQNPPTLSLFYKGQEVPVEVDSDGATPKKGYYTILENTRCSELYLIVTQGLQLPDSSEVYAFKTSPEHPYHLYKITHKPVEPREVEPLSQDTVKTDTNQPATYWAIERITPETRSITLPDNTLILLLNPQVISLEHEPWSSKDTIIKLPRLVFNNDLDEPSTQELGTKMALTALDYRALHKKLLHNTKLVQSRILSVALPQKRFGI